MGNRDFRLKNRRMGAIPDMDYRVILNIRTIANTNEMNVTSNRTVAPDGAFLAKMHVTDNLRTRVHKSCGMNFWPETTKRSNHSLADSSIGKVFGIPPTAVGGQLKSNLQNGLHSFSGIPPTAETVSKLGHHWALAAWSINFHLAHCLDDSGHHLLQPRG